MTSAGDGDFTAKFSSGEYVVVRDDHRGFVTPTKTLRLVPQRGTKENLDDAIHEALHAEFPHEKYQQLNEARVERAAINITALLWRLGYRWKKPKKRRKKKH